MDTDQTAPIGAVHHKVQVCVCVHQIFKSPCASAQSDQMEECQLMYMFACAYIKYLNHPAGGPMMTQSLNAGWVPM